VERIKNYEGPSHMASKGSGSILGNEIRSYINLKQSILSLFIGGLTSLLAGIVLGYSDTLLQLLPGLIILLPAALGMRGNIYATLASRLGSAFHMGTITEFNINSKTLRSNILASFSMGIVLSVYLGILAKLLTIAFNIPAMSLAEFVSISLFTGILSGVLMMSITIWVSFFSYNKHWDPDNITSPIITAAGDFFTIPSLIISAIFITTVGYTDVILYASIILSLGILYSMILSGKKKSLYHTILRESIPILAISGIFSAVAGLILESYISEIVLIPLILIFIPSFMETAGNLTNILSSRVSSKLHLGAIESNLAMSKEKSKEIKNSIRLGIIIYPIIGALTYYIGSYLGIAKITLAEMMIISVFSGLIIHAILMLLAMYISVFSFIHNIDPDNVTIPIMTSVADVTSIVILVTVIQLLGLI
jgi:mgtE-like transporter